MHYCVIYYVEAENVLDAIEKAKTSIPKEAYPNRKTWVEQGLIQDEKPVEGFGEKPLESI